MVTVKVGPTDKLGTEEHGDFYLYENHLVYHSLFFRKALEGPWKESQDKVVELPEEEPYLFRMFIQWLYTGDFHTGSEIEENLLDHCKLYALADKYQVLRLKNHVIDKIIGDKRGNLLYDPPEEAIRFVYLRTANSSKLRLLICAILLTDLDDASSPSDWFLDSTRTLAHDFPDLYFDLFSMNFAKIYSAEGWNGDLDGENCFFHEHGENERCKFAKKKNQPSKRQQK